VHSEVPPGFFPPGPPPTFAPRDLADVLRRMHGVDVSDVPINRDPSTTAEADALGARAFTRDGGVHLPPDEGPLERPSTRSLLAHELTHAAQQRALGPSLPPEDSPLGRELEAQAVAAESLALDQIPATWASLAAPPLVHGAAAYTWSGPAAFPGSGDAPSAGRVQRQPEHAPQPPVAVPSAPAGPPQAGQDPATLGPASDVLGSPVRTAASALADGASPATASGGAAGHRRRVRHLDLDDESAVGELADELYRRVRTRLRRELLVDRERCGLLSDFR
jgi:uncharacterized protein DUF4157